MRYFFAQEDGTVRSTLKVGSLLLVFPPEEQWLAEIVLRVMINELKEAGSLMELLEYVRVEHNKEEEN
jgi:nitrate reductase assembly molybdenum cofactor insertion protein NarJ